jgi:2-polyprenyl-3-methyl-5-hydroxy-6-metoxy-1,4-benzoquinol methylase
MASFGIRYARYYDILYADKDYASECDFLESVFTKYTDAKVSNILDLACGTGGHAIPLAKRGYHVAAMDYSPHMLRLAKRKATKSGVLVDFQRGNMTDIPFRREFDACISMFD